MTRNVTASSRCAEAVSARRMLVASVTAGLMATSTPAEAQKVVTQDNTTMRDVVRTPLSDLNLRDDPIPPVLIRAYGAPYDDTGLTQCMHILQEIGNLDAVLGEDFDTLHQAQASSDLAAKVAQNFVAGFIPFRGVIRHLSGAERHAWEFREAITAGLARRAYLKGLGQGMGCRYPARPAPPDLMVRPEGMTEAGSNER